MGRDGGVWDRGVLACGCALRAFIVRSLTDGLVADCV